MLDCIGDVRDKFWVALVARKQIKSMQTKQNSKNSRLSKYNGSVYNYFKIIQLMFTVAALVPLFSFTDEKKQRESSRSLAGLAFGEVFINELINTVGGSGLKAVQ